MVMTYFQQQLGPLTYPLLLCALAAAIILLERFSILLWMTITGRLKKESLVLLEQYHNESRAIREEIASVWLHNRQRYLISLGIRLLQVIALISPLLGLLGTVVGLIDIFDNLAEHSGPVEPALLANGLGIAMRTTAAGLIIAVPALSGAHLFQLWAEKLAHMAERAMNLYNLSADGVCTGALT